MVLKSAYVAINEFENTVRVIKMRNNGVKRRNTHLEMIKNTASQAKLATARNCETVRQKICECMFAILTRINMVSVPMLITMVVRISRENGWA